MSVYSKPLPVPTPLAAPFWEALRKEELKLQRCADCERYNHPPKIICPKCHGKRFRWEAVAPRGTVYSYTIVHRAPVPAFREEVPYAVALVDIDGTGVRLLASLEVPHDDIRIGMPVEVAFDKVADEFTLFRFRVANGDGEDHAA